MFVTPPSTPAARSWLICLMGAFLNTAACSEDEPAPDPGSQAESGASVPEDDDPIILETGDAVRGLTETTRIVDPGRGEKAPLRYAPAASEKRRTIVTVRVNAREGEPRAELSPRVRFELDTTVTPRDAGTWTRSFTIVGADVMPEARVAAEALTTMKAEIEALVGRRGHVEYDSRGEVLDFGFDATVTSEMLAPVVSAFAMALNSELLATPEDALGRGAEWEATRQVDLHGLRVWQVARYRFSDHDANQIEIDADLQFPLAEVSGQPVGFPAVPSIAGFEGSGKWSARIDVAQARAIEAHLFVEATFSGLDTQGQPASGKFGIDVTVEEDYLAAADPRVQLDGSFAQGGLVIGRIAPKSRVWFNKKRLKVSEAGDFVFGFHIDASRRALLSFALPDTPPERHVVHVEPREFEPESIEGLPEEMVSLERETRRELHKSRRQVNKVRNHTSDVPYFADGFVWPVRGRLSSTYGRRRILNGEEKGIHWGVDIATSAGKKVKCPAGGVVVLAEKDVPLSGNLLIIDHGFGVTSSFLHLRKFKVAVGDIVKRSQVIAEVGATGRTTGPHLDWRMNWFGNTRIDPELVPSRRRKRSGR